MEPIRNIASLGVRNTPGSEKTTANNKAVASVAEANLPVEGASCLLLKKKDLSYFGSSFFEEKVLPSIMYAFEKRASNKAWRSLIDKVRSSNRGVDLVFPQDQLAKLEAGNTGDVKLIGSLMASTEAAKADIYVEAILAQISEWILSERDGWSWSYGDLIPYLKGYRSQALREASNKKGFEAYCMRRVAQTLNTKSFARDLVKAMNKLRKVAVKANNGKIIWMTTK